MNMNGIKPTRLWHLTSKKHFCRDICDKIMTVYPHEQRNKFQILQLLAIGVPMVMAYRYTYGPHEDKIEDDECCQ